MIKLELFLQCYMLIIIEYIDLGLISNPECESLKEQTFALIITLKKKKQEGLNLSRFVELISLIPKFDNIAKSFIGVELNDMKQHQKDIVITSKQQILKLAKTHYEENKQSNLISIYLSVTDKLSINSSSSLKSHDIRSSIIFQKPLEELNK